VLVAVQGNVETRCAHDVTNRTYLASAAVAGEPEGHNVKGADESERGSHSSAFCLCLHEQVTEERKRAGVELHTRAKLIPSGTSNSEKRASRKREGSVLFHRVRKKKAHRQQFKAGNSIS
jgi:hypothetical protein